MLQVTVQRNKDRLITSWLLSCFLFAFENKNVPRERWEFVTDSDTGPHQGPHQVIFRCFRASGPHHLCWCVMEKGALKETYTFHWERNIKGGGGTIWGIINRCTYGVRGSQPSVCEIETPNSWSCFGSKRCFCWKQSETRSCLKVWWMWSFLLKKKNPSSSSSL